MQLVVVATERELASAAMLPHCRSVRRVGQQHLPAEALQAGRGSMTVA